MRVRSRRNSLEAVNRSSKFCNPETGDLLEPAIAGEKSVLGTELQATGRLQRIRCSKPMPYAKRGGEFYDVAGRLDPG